MYARTFNCFQHVSRTLYFLLERVGFMSDHYLLGLDNGGTLVKAGLYTVGGSPVAFASADIVTILGKDGIVERDMTCLWEVNCQVIKEVINKAGIDSKAIIGVSTSGHGNGLYLVDENGQPIMNGIYSTDMRAKSELALLVSSGICDTIYPKIMQTLYAGQLAPLLIWLMKNEPEVLKKAKWALGCIDYIRLCLTGEAYAELTNMSAAGVMNQNSRSYDDDILALMGISECRRLFAPVAKSCDICGKVTQKAAMQTGLCAGTPVAGGFIDITACAIATGIVDTSRLCMIAGTWSINEFISKKPILSKELLLTSVYCIEDYYMITDGSMTSASNLDWFIRELFDGNKEKDNVFKIADSLVESVKPEDSSVIFLPFLYGTNVDAYAKSCFLGLSGWHTKAHMLRAVFEGIVFSHRMHIEKLLRLSDQPKAIRMAGGVAKSKVWVQMFADALQMSVEISDSSELGTMGVAMCAAVATGRYASLLDATIAFTKISHISEPDPTTKELYNKKYALYQKAIECLQPVWKEWG